jgi:uncharacterized protein (DUF3820 family)
MDTENVMPEYDDLIKLANFKMPFGKYKGRALIDLPEPYVVWFHNQGFPNGELGGLLTQLYEIKLNGLEYLIEPLKNLDFKD